LLPPGTGGAECLIECIRKSNHIFPGALAFDALKVWTNNDNDQGVGEAVKKLTS
jgi:hypothetical protein